MPQGKIPGSVLPYDGQPGMFSLFRPLIRATDGLTLSQVCAITGLEPSAVQNWVKRGFVARPIQKKYRERQLARILLICALRDCMQIDRIGALMAMVNGSANDESDDIVPEDQLYDYLCACVGDPADDRRTPAEIPAVVASVLKTYRAPSPAAAQRLEQALTVMVYAYTAGQLKQEAERRFLALEEETK